MDVLVPILGLQKQHLHDDQIGTAIMNGAIQKDDAIVKQQIADRHLSLRGIFASVHGDVVESRILHFPISCETTDRPKKTGAA
jgi:hypothetical protein